MAFFDMDGTLIRPKHGKFSNTSSDWNFFSPEVVKKLRKMYLEENYGVAIFTNQKGISDGFTNESVIAKKFELMTQKLDIPLVAFIASADDNFRKPNTGMLELYQNSV